MLPFTACQDRIWTGNGAEPGAQGGAGAAGGATGDSGVPFVPPNFDRPDTGMVIDAPLCPGPFCPTDASLGPLCGNAKVEDGETCDDGNAAPGDGCSGLCRTEPNYQCPTAGMACVSTIVCGDKKVSGGEACDDGNAVAMDGCSDKCEVEMGFACSDPGMPCTPAKTDRCGDSLVNQGESCDDGGTVSLDGCSGTCQHEAGWTCAQPGLPCVRDEFCGDGRLNSMEQCDDKNAQPGDGCTGTCKLEPFFSCPTPGAACQTTIVCGDLAVVADEACDDGNTAAGDGCSNDCKQIEAGHSCPRAQGVGGPCQPVPMLRCGDSILSYGEFCDDGNPDNLDGCSSACRVESGFTCGAPGTTCTLVEWCGNGKLSVANGEQCDDGDTDGIDGCSSQCIVEANFVCPDPGLPCVSTVRCSDGIVTGGETCDDGNTSASDGCGAACQIESGWSCMAGRPCRAARCGDSIMVGAETCDDGDSNNGDGCSSTCKLESPAVDERNGWVCPTVGADCVRTTCGNGMREGSEQCDDGDHDMGDGCSPFCRNEPLCQAGACVTQCGDGLLLPQDKTAGQECDDGNTIAGDGCSAACKIEQGYTCADTLVSPDPLVLPIVYRDFKAYENGGHVGFQWSSGDPIDHTPDQDIWTRTALGTAADTLPDGTSLLGKPVFKWYVSCNGTGCTNLTPAAGQTQPVGTTDATMCNAHKDNATGVRDMTPWGRPVFFCGYGDQDFLTFSQWYRDVPGLNLPIVDTLTLARQGNGSFRFSDTTFFPINGLGFGNENWAQNFHFTSEVRYWFEYDAAANANLTFFGDDDVWVFVGGKLAVDISGTHGQVQDGVTLNANTTDINGMPLNLTDGAVYEIVVFQAERNTSGSSYQLTLSNFTATRSACTPVCGDGIVTPNEGCDLGTAGNTGAYGTCNADCSLPARCGDALVSGGNGEDCDNGINSAPYGGTALLCGPRCKWAPRCGDNMVDSADGEACDQGASNGMGYGFCSANCQLGPRCGDGAVTNAETCDDGVALNGTSGSKCQTNCALKCGNGIMDAGEACDNGTANNTGDYGMCSSTCSLGQRCGDGIRNGPEQCDDGANDGSYGTCAPMCLFGPRCGDMVVQMSAGEACDLGSQNLASPYGKNQCSTRCLPAPFCGDRTVDTEKGENCDDGVNDARPGSCAVNCSAAIPLPSCGDGIMQAGEQCDAGNANGTAGSTCDIRCKIKCGNGFKDPGEQCDDGVNDGSYGSCNANCSLAAYCGDGAKNGNEQCDLGNANAVNPYGFGQCTTSCTASPFCGDGRIQAAFGEACDGSVDCNGMCKIVAIE